MLESDFLDPHSFHHLIGDLRHGKIGSLPVSLLYYQLLHFLKGAEKSFKPEVGSIPYRLLEDNKRQDKIPSKCDLLAIDADIVFFYDAATKETDIQFKAYFDNPGFERPPEQHRVVLHIYIKESNNLQHSISVPLQVLMVGWGDVTEGSQGYCHSITFLDEERELEQWFYIGITTRNWLQRMEEHLREVKSGSNKRFHAAWRAYAGDAQVVLGSELIVLNHTYNDIMNWEEEQVDIHMTSRNSLNMIPGGFKGLRFLHEHRLTSRVDVTLEERDAAITKYVKGKYTKPRSGRAGVPNLLLSTLWLDDNYYLKVLASRNDVLTPGQVVAIRQLANVGKNEDQIMKIVGARNVKQVKRVLAGKTYKRIT